MQKASLRLLGAAVSVLLAITAGAGTKRSVAERLAFQREHPCPATGQRRGACPGYVIDHVVPLACAGYDHRSNMQWQTTADARAKDRWERQSCARR